MYTTSTSGLSYTSWYVPHALTRPASALSVQTLSMNFWADSVERLPTAARMCWTSPASRVFESTRRSWGIAGGIRKVRKRS